MAHCININHPEYKKLVPQFKGPEDLLKAKISIWQENNGLDNFPTIDQLEERKNILYDKMSIEEKIQDKAKQIFEKGNKISNFMPESKRNMIITIGDEIKDNFEETVKITPIVSTIKNISDKFPEKIQSFTYDCGACAMQQILEFVGVKKSEKELIKELNTNDKVGTTIPNIIKVANDNGLLTIAQKTNIDSLINELRKGNISILPIQYNKENQNRDFSNVWNEGHYVVLIGVINNKLVFEDPADVKRFVITKEDLLNRWHDKAVDGTIYDNYAVTFNLPVGEKGNIKVGVDFIFKAYPELSSIGTQEQYSKYLDTIFPDSKVKDILLHGSPNENLEIVNATWKRGFYATAYEEMAKGAGGSTNWDKVSKIYRLIVNAKNPRTELKPAAIADMERNPISYIKEQGYDSFIINNQSFKNNRPNEEVVVFEPEQVHFLGSKQDIEGFRDYVNTPESKNTILLQKNDTNAKFDNEIKKIYDKLEMYSYDEYIPAIKYSNAVHLIQQYNRDNNNSNYELTMKRYYNRTSKIVVQPKSLIESKENNLLTKDEGNIRMTINDLFKKVDKDVQHEMEIALKIRTIEIKKVSEVPKEYSIMKVADLHHKELTKQYGALEGTIKYFEEITALNKRFYIKEFLNKEELMPFEKKLDDYNANNPGNSHFYQKVNLPTNDKRDKYIFKINFTKVENIADQQNTIISNIEEDNSISLDNKQEEKTDEEIKQELLAKKDFEKKAENIKENIIQYGNVQGKEFSQQKIIFPEDINLTDTQKSMLMNFDAHFPNHSFLTLVEKMLFVEALGDGDIIMYCKI